MSRPRAGRLCAAKPRNLPSAPLAFREVYRSDSKLLRFSDYSIEALFFLGRHQGAEALKVEPRTGPPAEHGVRCPAKSTKLPDQAVSETLLLKLQSLLLP